MGAEVPELHQKFPLSLGQGHLQCPKLKTDPPKNVALDPPPPLNVGSRSFKNKTPLSNHKKFFHKKRGTSSKVHPKDGRKLSDDEEDENSDHSDMKTDSENDTDTKESQDSSSSFEDNNV